MANVDVITATLVRSTTHAQRAPLGICECDDTETTPTAADTFTTPIPAVVSQISAAGTETVQVTGGTLQTLATTRTYYLVSNITAASTGQSMLRALKNLLEASLGAVTWTVVINKVGATYRIQLSHGSGTSKTVTFSAGFATQLGFASASFAVGVGLTVTADYPSLWWWTPDMPISLTGPDLFDPSLTYGVPESAGASQRAPDMTTAYVHNGEQWSAEYIFNGVTPYYTVKASADFPNRSFEVWWRNGPQRGKKFLWWRNRDNATNSSAPSAGSSSPYRYIIYAPDETLRGKLPAKSITETNLAWWNVRLNCLVTEAGESPLS